MSTFAAFAPMLRKRGFRKTWSTRSGGTRMDEWQKQIEPHRLLDLQLWEDGQHRISHWVEGVMATSPTPFTDEKTLDAAIIVESTRTDNYNLAKARS